MIAVDLPSHGRDWTAARDVTLQSHVESVCQVLDTQPEPVVLVGQSRGGIVISQAAEQRPEQIRALVYLAAFLIPNGEAMLQPRSAIANRSSSRTWRPTRSKASRCSKQKSSARHYTPTARTKT